MTTGSWLTAGAEQVVRSILVSSAATPDWRWLWAAAGLMVAFFGRRLYFVFLACVGFAYGFVLAQFIGLEGWPYWALVVGLGLLGALLSRSFERVVLALVGVILGSLLVLWMITRSGQVWGPWTPLLVVAGAIFGALLFIRIYRVALVLATAIFGSILFVGCLTPALAEHGSFVVPIAWRWPLVAAVALFAALRQFTAPDEKKKREEKFREKTIREVKKMNKKMDKKRAE